MKSNNKHKIIDATFALSLKYGFDNVSIKQIQEESGVATGSIYYYFKNKDELLEYMINKYLMDQFYETKNEIKEFKGPFLEKMNFIFRYEGAELSTKEDDFPYILTRPKVKYKDYFMLLTSIYHKHPEISTAHEIHDELYKFFYELVQEAVENNEIRDDMSVRKIVIFIQTSLKGFIGLLVFQPHIAVDELVESNIELIWEAIKKQ
ncbi:MAG: TetR/AcrR family transcriptional regulator [Methanobacteriaceae archaeon]|jgi:AcrR family transcriptional regulator|nr:TetR/AcrR family transcriptional regulator [Candidatus Methanorudis spinitermitis]